MKEETKTSVRGRKQKYVEAIRKVYVKNMKLVLVF